MGSRSTRNVTPLRGFRSRGKKKDQHEVVIGSLLDALESNVTDVSHVGSFDAVCLSGIRDNVVLNSDPFSVHDINNRYEILFRPLIKHGASLPNLVNETDPNEVLRLINLHRQAAFVATSDKESTNSEPPVFGQVVKVRCGQGSFKNGDCSDYIYESESVLSQIKITDYTNLRHIKQLNKAAQKFLNNNNVVRMGDVALADTVDIVDPADQIPGTVLPVSQVNNTQITSAFKTKNRPDHSGIDYGQFRDKTGGEKDSVFGTGKNIKGMDIVSILPGTVTKAKYSVSKKGDGTYGEVKLEPEINKKVGENGYGMRVQVKSETFYGDGTPVTIICNYGHLYDIDIAIFDKNGTKVKQGQVLGQMGTRGSSSGIHLHFDVTVNGNKVDPAYIFNWHNLTGWKHSSQKNDFYDKHPELKKDRID